jgi:hypothetical protein
MAYFAGLDVSVKETSVCIVDDAGKIVREVNVASEPEALLAVLKNLAYHFKRIGLPPSTGPGRRLSSPEILEPIGGQLGIAHRVLDVFVPEPCLQRPRVVPGIG